MATLESWMHRGHPLYYTCSEMGPELRNTKLLWPAVNGQRQCFTNVNPYFIKVNPHTYFTKVNSHTRRQRLSRLRAPATRWSTLVMFPLKSAGYVPRFAPHRALKLISRCKSTFDESVALHRVVQKGVQGYLADKKTPNPLGP